MKRTFGFKCTNKNCGMTLDFDLEWDDVKDFVKKTKCPKCESKIKRTFEFGGAILRGGHYTKRSIK